MLTHSKKDMDRQLRVVAFAWLSEQVDIHGDVLSRSILAQGFVFGDQRIPLVSPQGIFKPRILAEYPLTITTSPSGPYDDSFSHEGLLLYKYRGTDPNHRDNVGLRNAMQEKVPLIYFHGVVPGKYLAVWPVFVVGDDPQQLTFTVAADDYYAIDNYIKNDFPGLHKSEEARRIYVTSSVKQRLHQRSFRERVIHAYREQCAFCRLKHLELLDAAHIIPDSEPGGDPVVTNGVALCKLHHAAFDSFMLGIRPDFKIEVREDILEEEDGPMLLHGLQGLHLKKIILPKHTNLWPNPDLLELRYEKFRSVG
jgi:putative restriction endonuclease